MKKFFASVAATTALAFAGAAAAADIIEEGTYAETGSSGHFYLILPTLSYQPHRLDFSYDRIGSTSTPEIIFYGRVTSYLPDGSFDFTDYIQSGLIDTDRSFFGGQLTLTAQPNGFQVISSPPRDTCGGWTLGTTCSFLELSYPELAVATLHGDVFSYRAVLSAIPEPATWSFMIAGFGLTGTVLRQSRRKPLHA